MSPLDVPDVSKLVVPLVLQPGDRVLIGLSSARVPTDQLAAMMSQLRAAFPGVKFVVVGDVSALAVERAADAPDSGEIPVVTR